MGTVLELFHLTKIYSRSHLGRVKKTVGVQDLSLEIAEGEIFGLLGLNGAGKTTTFKLALGLLFPTSGSIRLMGREMPDRSSTRQVGYLPEIPYFPQHFTVDEVLRFYGLLSGLSNGEIEPRAEKILNAVGMAAHKHKRIRECSKGMMQRLSLAQALIHDPKVLVLDEPVTGLDPLGLAEMRQMILDLNSQGKTIFFSSHVIAEVEKIAHRVGILVNGNLVKTIRSEEWGTEPGVLEKIFVSTVREHGGSALA